MDENERRYRKGRAALQPDKDESKLSHRVYAITREGVLISTHADVGAAASAVERHSNIQNRGGLKGQVIQHIAKLDVGQSFSCRGVRCQRVAPVETSIDDPVAKAHDHDSSYAGITLPLEDKE